MDEIMTLEEVAKYLKVSERTVINWVNKGELPGGKIGTSWRFKRADIEKWVNRKLGSGSIDSREEFFISRLLVPERVVILDCKTKNEALDSLIEVMSRVSGISSFEKLREAVFKREKIMSTGIGFGIAVPHVRIEGVNGVYMAFGVSKKGIPDYESLDGKPVHIIVLIVAGVGQHVQYLKALSRISRILRDKKTMESLIAAKDEQEIYNILVSKDKEV
ncbi:MAG TPA: helix-turn-helix domain-containing protein [Candidatus Marinimicrobia bacterium]|nr:helix-turn-helix domain-containing protein [Candidatus Neomarinimicrobiota bacterium]